MTAALTPVLALAYLRELSADVRAAIVLGADGEVLALSAERGREAGAGVEGDRAGEAGRGGAFAIAARALLAEAPLVRALTAHGGAFGARGDRHGIVVATGPLALPGLTLHDLASVLAALGGAAPQSPVSDASPAAAGALLAAL